MDWVEPSAKFATLTQTAEAARVGLLRDMGVLDTQPDPRFDRIAELAALIFDTSRAAVVLIDADRLWLKAKVGLTEDEWPRSGTLSEIVLETGEPVFAGDIRKVKALSGPSNAATPPTRFYAAAPLRAPNGTIIGALAVSDDRPRRTPDARQQAALIDLAALTSEELVRDAEAVASQRRHAFDLERLDLALNAAHLGAFEWDLGSDAILMSDRMRQINGSDTEVDNLERLIQGVPVEDRETVLAAIREGLATRGRYELEHRLVHPEDGTTKWLSSVGVLIKDGGDHPGHVIGVVQDITARKIAEEQRETLVAELDHRVKNVLSAVNSLAAQSARKATSLEGFLKTFAGRLKSMASAHQLLTATRWRGAGMLNIATAELGGIAPGQTRWEGPDLLLAPRAANAMSLALHELATNAVKFGALSVEAGRVDVRWRATPVGGLELQWNESGGPPVSAPTRRGFGATLLEKVTGRELDGEVSVEHRREGVTVLIRAGASTIAPASKIAEVAAEPPPPAATSGSSSGLPYNAAPARIDGLRLLIVEDALLLALELEAGLQEAGAIVAGAAADVSEALGMMDRPIDAAVLDANLNGVSVLPVAEALAARGVPFVFATGYGDNRFNPGGFDAPVIRKPYDVTQVAAALAQITGRV
jgi:PAS domain S-box-containing protein